MVVTFLSANGYSDPSKNNGDCILVDNGSELVIYDCGCEEHARRVVEYMDTHAYSKAKLVLSHNDADHFDGIPYLIEQDKLSAVYTLLLATVYKGNIIKNLIMDCQSYTKNRPNETTGGIFVSWRRKEELPTGA